MRVAVVVVAAVVCVCVRVCACMCLCIGGWAGRFVIAHKACCSRPIKAEAAARGSQFVQFVRRCSFIVCGHGNGTARRGARENARAATGDRPQGNASARGEEAHENAPPLRERVPARGALQVLNITVFATRGRGARSASVRSRRS